MPDRICLAIAFTSNSGGSGGNYDSMILSPHQCEYIHFKKHPSKDCIHPKCEQASRSATSKAIEQKFPLRLGGRGYSESFGFAYFLRVRFFGTAIQVGNSAIHYQKLPKGDV